MVTTATVAAHRAAPAPGAVLNASGYVTARRRATVSSKVTGKVLEVFVEEGKAVRKGQVLARLDDSQMRAALAVAQAQLEARSGRGRGRSAAARSGADARAPRRAREGRSHRAGRAGRRRGASGHRSRRGSRWRSSRCEVAESQVALRQTDLNDMVVRAPFDGVAISKDAQPGEMISPVSAGGGFTRTGIGTIVDMSSLEIEVDVNESYINRVRPAQPVEAVLDAYPDWRIPAHVITTVPSADRQKATVRVRIGFETARPADPAGHGRQGVVPERAAAAPAADAPRARLLVPKAAVRTRAGRERGLRRQRRPRRAAGGHGRRRGRRQVEVVSGSAPASGSSSTARRR